MLRSWITLRANTWVFLATLSFLAFGSGIETARAVSLYWDPDGNAANNNTTTGAGLGGTNNGTWGSNFWFNGTTDGAWADGSDAVFWGNTATSVAINPGATRSVNSLAFKTTGYTIQGSTVDLAGPTITVDSGAATINSILTGSAGLVKAGSGALHLGSSNSYSGGTTVNGGLLGISSGSLGTLPAAPTTNVTLNNGATLRFNYDGPALNINRQIVLGTGGGAINSNGNNAGVAGLISGTSLTKLGTGTLTLTNNNTYTGGTTVSAGTLLVNSAIGSATGSGAVTVNALATLGGTGTITGNVTNNGIVAPGINVNQLSLSGTYTQGAVAKLAIDLASTANYDKLIVGGAATLAGSLDVTLTNGFVPQSGNSFTLLTASGLGGTQFTTTNLPMLTGGLSWNVAYSATAVTLSVNGALAGDYNLDAKVDAADYVVWRNGLGTTFQQSDYDVWKTNFGKPDTGTGGATSSGAVPEPAGLCLLALSSIALLSTRRSARGH
jgi:autotransporter-associated beta strand protein